jgi:hypothetical protein
MFAGADENSQLNDVAEPGPRHLRPRRFRHAARGLVPLATSLAALRGLLAALRGLPAWLEAALPRRLGSAVPLRARRGVAAAAVLAVSAFGLSAALAAPAGPATVAGDPVPATAGAGRAEDAAGSAASRGHRRGSTGTAPSASPSADRPPAAAPSATPSTPAPAPTKPGPVGGLTRLEMDNAIAIVEVAKRENLPKRAAVVAIATALQESHLRNLANPNLPESLQHPNQGVGYDYDSVGLFQQRPNWGSVPQLMDPHESARRFYRALLAIPGWGDYAVTVAAQMVQRSAFPDAYAKWEGLATQVVDATM